MSAASDGAQRVSRGLSAKRLLQLAAFALAVAGSAYLAVVPVYSGSWTDSTGASGTASATLIEVNGTWAIVLLAVPVLITLVPLFARGRAWQVLSIAAAVLLGVVTILGSMTIGVFYMPALIVAIVAACLPVRVAIR